MHLGVIASMKKGLEHFIDREIQILATQGCTIYLFLTKYGTGLYGSKPDWHLHRWNLAAVLLWQLYFLSRSPVRYLRLLWEALTLGAIVDFVLAWYFSRAMAQIDGRYATFGDRKFFVGYFCKQILNKPLAVTIHAYELYDNPNLKLFQRTLAACDQIITPTEYNREYPAKHFHVASSRAEIIRYSVDTEDYRPARKFVILIVGFFVQENTVWPYTHLSNLRLLNLVLKHR